MRLPRDQNPNRICATCDFFKLKGQPGAKKGRGLCTMYVRTESWDWDRCIIYTPAATMEDRLRWLRKFTQQKAATPQEEGNGTDEKI